MFFNAFLLIPFCHVAAAVSHQVKGICLVLGMCCSSCSPCRAALVQAVPTLLCCLGSEQSSRAVCWLFTHFTVENSSMSVSYRKRINISFKWSGLVGRKQVILWSTLFTGKWMDCLQNIYLTQRMKNTWGVSVSMSISKCYVVHS